MQRISITNPQNIIDGTAKKYYFKLRNTGGPKGDKGDKGDTGATGPQGPQGNAATVSVGSTTTLSVGQDATVTNSGSIYNAVLDFGIPQGPQGPQGAKGDKGDTGAQGETGPRGPQGERGTNATVYVGTTTTTNPGTQARVYNSGTDSNAVLNFEIPRGDVGPSVPLVQETGNSTTKAMSQNATTEALNGKQNTLTAGSNIQISGSTISATDTKYSAGNGITLTGTQFSANTSILATKNDLGSYYTKTQIDSQMAAKQDDLVAGSNIQIAADGKTISATDTTYTAGTGLTLTGTEFSADTTVLATQTDLTTALAPKLESEVVSTLPTTGEEGKLYLTPKAHTTSTATGNPITATVAEDAGALESFQLDGDTYQQTYTGKNLFDIEQYANAILRGGGTGVSLEKIDSRTLRATNLIKQSNNFCGIPVPNYTELLGKTVTVSGSITRHGVPNTRITFAWNTNSVSAFGQNLALSQDGTFSLTQSIPASAPSGAIGLLVVIYANGEGTLGEVDAYVDWSDIQLEVGSSATSYEPFVGGTPSPNPTFPQPIQTVTGLQTVEIQGKNLLGLGQPVIVQGLTISVDTENNDITASGTATGTYPHLSDKSGLNIPAGTYTFSIKSAVANSVSVRLYRDDGTYPTGIGSYIPAGSTSCTFTIDFDCHHVGLLLGGVSSGTVVPQTVISEIMLEAGSTASSFVPYSKQTYEIDLRSPKNLFDKDTIFPLMAQSYSGGEVSYLGGSFSIEATSDDAFSPSVWDRASKRVDGLYIQVKKNTTYTLSYKTNTSEGIKVLVYAYNGTNHNSVGSTITGNQGTFTTGDYENVIIRFGNNVNGSTLVYSDIQLEEGSTATAYDAGIELCKLGTYQDYIWKDGDEWKVHKELRKSVFDQNSGWAKNQYGTNAYNVKTEDIFTAVAEIGVISPQFIAKSYNGRTDSANNIIFADSNDGMAITSRGITVRNTAWSELTSFITWVTANPVTAYYALATATDTVITDTALIAQLEAIRTASLENGANTIINTATGSNLAGDMEIGYYGYNPRNRYGKWLWLDINNEYEQIGS